MPGKGLLALAAGMLAWLAACAGAPVKSTQGGLLREPAPPPPATASVPKISGGLTEAEVRKLDPRTFAARFRRPSFCEQAARALRPVSRDKAWEALAACADKGNFTLLDRLVAQPWLEDLQTRPDAPKLIAQVIAARGGDEAADGAILRDHEVPICALEQAVKQPAVFRGRLVVLGASIGDVREWQGRTTVRLLAKGFMGPNDVHVLGRLPQPDPILRRGGALVVVGRFEGLEEVPGEGKQQGEWIAVLTMIGYSEPSAAGVD